MTAQKQAESGSTRHSTATAAQASGRKPWKKRTPVEVVLDQIDRVRKDVTQKEEELKLAKRQLDKLEQAKKLLETS